MTALPPTSLILCSRDRESLLCDCVDSILRGDAVPSELIVIDDSERENARLAALGEVNGCEVRYRWRRGAGLSSAVNDGARLARHDVLAFTQDDAEVDPAWLAALVGALIEAGPDAIVTGAVHAGRVDEGGAFVSAVTPDEKPAVYTSPPDRDVLYALNMAMYRSALESIGPFDERLGPGTRFPASEDSDFAYRALRGGHTIVYEPRAIVRHRAWREAGAYSGFRWGYGFARGGFYAKHLGDSSIRRRLWHDVRDHVTPLPRLAVRDRQEALGHLALSAGVVAGAVRWLLSERS